MWWSAPPESTPSGDASAACVACRWVGFHNRGSQALRHTGAAPGGWVGRSALQSPRPPREARAAGNQSTRPKRPPPKNEKAKQNNGGGAGRESALSPPSKYDEHQDATACGQCPGPGAPPLRAAPGWAPIAGSQNRELRDEGFLGVRGWRNSGEEGSWSSAPLGDCRMAIRIRARIRVRRDATRAILHIPPHTAPSWRRLQAHS